jgi:hypothetical protein
MSAQGNQSIEDFFEEYRQQRSGLGDLKRRMLAVSATVLSPRREVSVTVGHSGVVTGLAFPTNAYKQLTPKELADLLLNTIREAKDQAAVAAADIIAPLLPAGLNARELMRGNLSLDEMVPAEPRLHPIVEEQLRR